MIQLLAFKKKIAHDPQIQQALWKYRKGNPPECESCCMHSTNHCEYASFENPKFMHIHELTPYKVINKPLFGKVGGAYVSSKQRLRGNKEKTSI